MRAGLRIVEEAEELEAVGGAPLRLRVGINTGEALVRLGVSPGSGEGFLTGDAINTASRLQSVAPEMGVAVGVADVRGDERRLRLSRSSSRATLKGKAEPVRVFQPLAPAGAVRHRPDAAHTIAVRRPGDRSRVTEGDLRQDGRSAVGAAGDGGRASPGSARAGSWPSCSRTSTRGRELVTWRQGRCLPYGEGITFWALGEIVKAHAGILESDDPAVATASSTSCCPRARSEPGSASGCCRCSGIEASSSAEREELFTAWRRFLELIAEARSDGAGVRGPALGRRGDARVPRAPGGSCRGRPALIVGNDATRALRAARRLRQRSSQHDRRSTWRRSRPRRRHGWSPLCLTAAVIPAELQQPILERAGGQPALRRGVRPAAEGQGPAGAQGVELGAAGRGPRCRSPTRSGR